MNSCAYFGLKRKRTDSSIGSQKTTPITPGMRELLETAEKYTYGSSGIDGNKLDCVAAVNLADGKYYGSIVDAVWDSFKGKCTEWEVITNFNDYVIRIQWTLQYVDNIHGTSH